MRLVIRSAAVLGLTVLRLAVLRLLAVGGAAVLLGRCGGAVAAVALVSESSSVGGGDGRGGAVAGGADRAGGGRRVLPLGATGALVNVEPSLVAARRSAATPGKWGLRDAAHLESHWQSQPWETEGAAIGGADWAAGGVGWP